MLETFNGTSKSFFELTQTSSLCDNSVPSPAPDDGRTLHNGHVAVGNQQVGDVVACGGENSDSVLPSSPAWYHPNRELTSQNYESLALFCLELGLRELGLAFALQAHWKSRHLESPDLIEEEGEIRPTMVMMMSRNDSPSNQLPSLSLRLLKALGLPVSSDPSDDDDDDEDDSSGSSPTVAIRSFDIGLGSRDDDDDEWLKGVAEVNVYSHVSSLRKHPSILRSPSSPDWDGGCDGAASRREKHVRFNLSPSHPTPDLEAEYGGRSNRRRILDMAARRNSPHDDDADPSNLEARGRSAAPGLLDCLVDLLWPKNHRRGRCCHLRRSLIRYALDLTTVLACLAAILAFSLLLLTLSICMPLVWVTGADGSIGYSTCVRLLDYFWLSFVVAL